MTKTQETAIAKTLILLAIKAIKDYKVSIERPTYKPNNKY